MGRLDFDRAMERTWALDAPAGPPLSPSTPRMVVKVYDGGGMPTVADRVYLCRPVEVSTASAPEEGGPYSADADGSRSIPVVFLNRAPAVGDLAIAHRIGGAWVAIQPAPSRGFCPLCSMEAKGALTLTFTFSTGLVAFSLWTPRGEEFEGENRVYSWNFFVNGSPGSDLFDFYPNFYV